MGVNNTLQLHRVVITGMGAVSPAGFGADALWDKLMAGESCIRKLPDYYQEAMGLTAGGYLPDYDPLEHGFTKKESRRFSKFVQFAILASDEAMAQAGIDMEQEDSTRFSCCFGSGIGGIQIFADNAVTLETKGPKRVNPLFIPTMISNIGPSVLSMRYGIHGEVTNTVTACATGTHNIGDAYRLIRFGLTDAALAGGSEECVMPLALAGFNNMGALSRQADVALASRPFDVNRDGFVAGEGGAALVLESLEHAQARGANIIAEVVGFGSTGDAYHMTAPDPSGAGVYRAMANALAEGGFTPDDLGQLNAHGTSTHANDFTEAKALHLLCGEHANQVPVTSVKGCIGHTLGAAGALEAVVLARSMVEGVVPPTIGYAEPDPELDVLVSNKPIAAPDMKVGLSNSVAFGGHNATLAIAPFAE